MKKSLMVFAAIVLLAMLLFASEPAGLLIQQNFEGTGYDNSETWTESAGVGTIDPDEATTVLRGLQSLEVAAGAGESSVTSPAFAAQSDMWTFFRWRVVDSTPSSVTGFFRIYDTTQGDTLVGLALRSDGTIVDSWASSHPGPALADNTTYYIWVHYVKGTGANAVMTVYVGTDTTRPVTPMFNITNGAETADAVYVQLYSNNSQTYFFDQIYVDNAELGDMGSYDAAATTGGRRSLLGVGK